MELIDLKIAGCGGLSLAVETVGDGGARPCLLETRADAVVYLGAICDFEGTPREWVEIRVQEISGIEGKLESAARDITGPMLDKRWTRMVDGHVGSDGEALVRGPWEHVHGGPVFLNAEGSALAEPTGGWKLCLDDELLAKHRLATFSETWHRYLISEGDGPKFVPLTATAPRSPATVEAEVAFAGLQAVNREAGLMMVRRLAGLKYEDFVDFISGKDFGGNQRELLRVPPVGLYKRFLEKNAHGQAWVGFIHGRSSVAERLAEVLFLKLNVLRGAFEALSSSVAAQELPYLGLSADSFGVSLAEPAPGLPFLWNHRVGLCALSSVMPLPVGPGGDQMLLPCADISRSIYRAERLTGAIEGKGRVRIRKITPADDGGFSVIEGTLQTDEGLEVSRKDVLELDLRLSKGKRFKIHGNFVSQRAAQGEHRFLSVPVALPAEVLQELEGGGVQFSEKVEFRVIPSLGPTADLFSMGVLAVRTLFNQDTPLAESVDDVLGLMHAYGHTFEANEWETGSGNLFSFVNSDKGKDWREKIGPQRVAFGVSPEDAALAIPNRLWWQVVEFAGRLFPGEMPGSFAKDFDDFEARAPERVFADPAAALDGLIENCRSLLFGNPVASREILSVIKGFSARQR